MSAEQQNGGRQSVDAAVDAICNIMRRGNMAGALQYVPELSRLLFLRVLDEMEQEEEKHSAAVSQSFSLSLPPPYRWRDWAAKDGAKRTRLTESAGGAFLRFFNEELLPHIKSFPKKPGSTMRQRVISQVFRHTEKTGFTSETDMLNALDRINALTQGGTDSTHTFLLSQSYESLLLKMGEKNNDGGQFYTPREVIRAMVRVVNPKAGESVYDPCCGTGGFLVQANEHMREQLGDNISAEQLETLSRKTFYGREKEHIAYPIALANLLLHKIDQPRIWHGNALSGEEFDGSLFAQEDHAKLHDVVLTNPPFGGKENKNISAGYDFPTSSTQVLFLQKVMSSLKKGGRCGIVMDEGFLFRTSETAFVKTKQRLLESCNLYCIVSLPAGVFTQAGAGVKTNLLFFIKGEKTEKVWYYDLSHVKVTKRQPLLISHFEEFFKILPNGHYTENSWWVFAQTFVENGYDLRAVNPSHRPDVDSRTPEELLAVMEKEGEEMKKALDALRAALK